MPEGCLIDFVYVYMYTRICIHVHVYAHMYMCIRIGDVYTYTYSLWTLCIVCRHCAWFVDTVHIHIYPVHHK